MKDMNICFDLSGDELKVVFAFTDEDEEHVACMTGKTGLDAAVPALASYDEKNKIWRYGYDVEKDIDAPSRGVVSILDALNMVSSDPHMYECGHTFPLKTDGSLEVSSSTPKDVCEGFYRYVATMTGYFLRDVSKKDDISFDDVKFTVLHAPAALCREGGSCAYDPAVVSEELKRLTVATFGIKKSDGVTLLSTSKALAYTAVGLGKNENDGDVLIFNIDCGTISVVRVGSENADGEKCVCVNGLSGHRGPVKIPDDEKDARSTVLEYVSAELSSRSGLGKIYCRGASADDAFAVSVISGKVADLCPEIPFADISECIPSVIPAEIAPSYAAAFGGAMAGLSGVREKVVLAKTYGTIFDWADRSVPISRRSHFSVLVDRGTALSFDGNPALTPDGKYLEFKYDKLRIDVPETRSILLYETSMTSRDIQNLYMSGSEADGYSVKYFDSPDGHGPYLYMPYGDPSGTRTASAGSARKGGIFSRKGKTVEKPVSTEEAEAAAIRKILGIDFVLASDGKSRFGCDENTNICLFVKDRSHPVKRILSPGGSVFCVYGIRIDREGIVTPFIENDTARNDGNEIKVEYLDAGMNIEGVFSCSDIFVGFKAV
ncbi:MAG: hypothetical protein LUD47_06870 [Clostridia bacterium]|nr:hypothetical protein [Clostridia bacterium]